MQVGQDSHLIRQYSHCYRSQSFIRELSTYIPFLYSSYTRFQRYRSHSKSNEYIRAIIGYRRTVNAIFIWANNISRSTYSFKWSTWIEWFICCSCHHTSLHSWTMNIQLVNQLDIAFDGLFKHVDSIRLYEATGSSY